MGSVLIGVCILLCHVSQSINLDTCNQHLLLLAMMFMIVNTALEAWSGKDVQPYSMVTRGDLRWLTWQEPLCDVELCSPLGSCWCPITGRYDWRRKPDADKVEPVSIFWLKSLKKSKKKKVKKHIQYIEEVFEGRLQRQPPQRHHGGFYLKWMGNAVFSLLCQICDRVFSVSPDHLWYCLCQRK